MPALTLKFIGAISLGLIYQFYYQGGDTFNYFHESFIINEAMDEGLVKWLKLIFLGGNNDPDLLQYTSRLYWYNAESEFMVSRIVALIGAFTFDTYSASALIFAILSFSGLWAMYHSFLKIYPHLSKEFAVAFFFIPSVFFWGSGVMKDTITLGCLGWLFFCFYNIGVIRKNLLVSFFIGVIVLFLLKEIRVFMLLAFMPPAALWVFVENNKNIENVTIRYLTIPIYLSIGGALAYYLVTNVSAGDARYDINNIGTYVKVNAEYLYAQSMYQGGSAYYLGELDGTLLGSLKLAPSAVWVSLFRPYLWEVNNPVMLLSALESLVVLLFTIRVILKEKHRIITQVISLNPLVSFCVIFSVLFAFAVGITSYNFGTLVRYKIPLMPMYFSALYIMLKTNKRKLQPRKLAA